MKKIAIITTFIFSASIFSCEKNDLLSSNKHVQATNDIKVIDGRLVFKSFDTFSKIYASLSIKKTEEQKEWAKSYEFISLIKAIENRGENDIYLNKMANTEIPSLYFSILNAKGEFQIGDDIMWFDKNKRYLAKGEEKLQKIKENPSISSDFFELKPKLIKPENQNSRINLSVNSGDARHQSQFTIGNFQYKYVHEVYTFTDLYPQVAYTVLNLAIKFEYSKPSWNNWYEAGESRAITINVSSDASYLGATQYFNHNQYLPTQTGTKTYPLGFWSSQSFNSNDYINLEVNGSINHLADISGAPAFNNSAYPLW